MESKDCMKTKPLWLTNAIERLQVISIANSWTAPDGRIISEGYPNTHEIEQELRRAYRSGKKARMA